MEKFEVDIVEVRCYLIGPPGAGKLSLASKFKSLGLSGTKTETRYTDKQKDPKDLYGLGIKKDAVLYKQYEEKSFLEKKEIQKEIQRFDYRKLLKVLDLEGAHVTLNFLPILEAKELSKIPEDKKNEDIDITEYPKVETLEYIEELIETKDGTQQTKIHNIIKEVFLDFKLMKEEIMFLMSKPPKYNTSRTIHLFLFCFSYLDIYNIKKLSVYIDYLSKHFNLLGEGVKCAVVGNNADKNTIRDKEEGIIVKNLFKCKSHYETYQRKKREEALAESNYYYNSNYTKQNDKDHSEEEPTIEMFYYEIIEGPNFNFGTTFEVMFKDLIFKELILGRSDDKEGQRQREYKRVEELLHQIVSMKPTFSKAERNTFTYPQTPGPNKYDNNVYDYPKDKELFRMTFSNTKGHRFANKIFIDKQGPIFPKYAKENRKIESGKDKNKKDQKARTEYAGFNNWNNRKKNEMMDMLDSNIPGYSLGTKQGHYDFKKERKLKSQLQAKELEDAIVDNKMTLHIKKPPRFKEQKDFSLYEENRKLNLQEIADKVKRKEDEGLLKRKEILQKQENERQRKIDEINLKQQKRDKYLEERTMQRTAQSDMFRSKSASKTFTKHFSDTPGPANYNTTTQYIPGKKGFTFGMKCTNERKKNKNDPEPDFATFKSDFDRILEKPGYKTTAPRFKEVPLYIPVERNDLEKLEKRTPNPNANGLQSRERFFNKRKENYNRVLQNKDRIQKEREDDLYNLMCRLPRNDDNETGDYYMNNINYNQVEERSPNYTMKGRYEHGGIFDTADNTNKLNPNDEGTDVYGKPLQDETYFNNLSRPQFNAVKPALPSFSFGKAERFYTKLPYKGKVLDEDEEMQYMLFKDGVFAPPDQQILYNPYAWKVYHNKGDRSSSYIKPQRENTSKYYKIKGFAEEIVDKTKQETKDRIEELKQLKETYLQEKREVLLKKTRAIREQEEELIRMKKYEEMKEKRKMLQEEEIKREESERMKRDLMNDEERAVYDRRMLKEKREKIEEEQMKVEMKERQRRRGDFPHPRNAIQITKYTKKEDDKREGEQFMEEQQMINEIEDGGEVSGENEGDEYIE